MALDPAANFVRDTTTASLDNSATTLAVQDAGMFPDPASEGEYNIVIWDAGQYPRPDQDPNVEICRVTARNTTSDELTVERGREDTAAAGHPSGSSVQVSPTAKMFEDIESEIDAAGSLVDSGTDNPDGGDRYQFPQSEDSVDLQGDGDIENAQSVGADRHFTDSRAVDAVVWTDGSTYYADGKNGAITSGSDAATVIQAAIDSLPPSGTGESAKESQGTVVIKQGTYSCSSSIILKKGLTLRGIGWDHVPGVSEDATEPATRLTFSGSHGFVPPNVDTELIPSVRVEDMALDGPGTASSSDCFACGANSNVWDLMRINNVNPRHWRRGFDARAGEIDSIWIQDSHFIRMGREAIWSETEETFIDGCFIYGIGSEGAAAGVTTEGIVNQTQVQSVNAPDNIGIDGQGGTGFAIGCWVGPAAENGDCFNNINVLGGGVLVNTTCTNQVVASAGGEVVVGAQLDGTASNADISHAGGADPQFWALEPGLTVQSSGARPRWNGFIGGGPFKGVDLSTTTGQYYFDQAVANGTSAAGKGAPAVWDGDNSRWIYPDSQSTVTP